jgi:hypothetical protein
MIRFKRKKKYDIDINYESGLVQHAARELKILGEDQDFVDGYLKMLTIFANMGHSGGSASVFIPTLDALLRYKNLCPLTNDPDEWMDVGHISGFPFWQSKRCPEAFSDDGGQTYHLLSDGSNSQKKIKIYQSEQKV